MKSSYIEERESAHVAHRRTSCSSWRLRSALLVALVVLCLPAAARSAQPAERPEYRAVRTTARPVIDGILDDEAWKSAPEITGFTQRDPEEGKPAKLQTRVRIAYSEDALYVAAFMEDDGPVTRLLTRRDNDFADGDFFGISIDAQHDRLSGASFEVNASNVQSDEILHNDIEDDSSWDAVWESAVQIVPGGWTAELRIPYSQLRFPARDVHVWGFNIGRWTARTREESYLVYTPKNQSGYVSRFADLVGIEGIKPPRGFEIVPYAVLRGDLQSRSSNPFVPAAEQRLDAGLDLKYGLTSSLTLTATINPDFGQVEVDPAVLNLTQFETFFPEKRPFFTEGANLFRFGNSPTNSRWNFNVSNPTFFYSRRIGRSPQLSLDADFQDAPGETTILGAAKISGSLGNGWNIGLIEALTDSEDAWYRIDDEVGKETVEPMTNYFVARATKDIGDDARLGVLFTSVKRQLDGQLEPALRSDAWFGGIDGHKFLGGKDWVLDWFAGTSLVRGSEEAIAQTQRSGARYYQRPDTDHVRFDPTRTSLTGWTGRIALAKQTGRWRQNFQAQAHSPGLELNDVGFQTRTDAIATHGVLFFSAPEVGRYTRSRNFWVAKFQNWNFGRDLTANGVMVNGSMELRNYWEINSWAGIDGRRIDDRLTRGGPAFSAPMQRWGGFEIETDARKRFSTEFSTEFNASGDGSRSQWYGMEFNFKPSPSLRLSLEPSYSRVHDTTQYVTAIADPTYEPTFGTRYVFATIEQRTVEAGVRAEWTASPRLSLQLFLQPFVASGDYEDFKQLVRGRDDEFAPLELEQSETGSRYRAYGTAFREPDFNVRSVRGSAVARWEFRPGSAIYLVWNENREDVAPIGDFRLRRDLSALTDAPSRDVFLIKVSYWLPM